jgi:NAD-dependent deacetylase
MSEQDNILKLKEMIAASDNIVFFGGAGVSTESGIPDFRSETGIYNTVHKYGRSPEEILSHSFFMRKPEIFYDFYKTTMIYDEAEPNEAHKALAKLEAMGKLKAVVTQNIDGLHQKAGSKAVYELHGTVLQNYCMKCGHAYDLSYVMQSEGVPRCMKCGGIVKPDVVLYEEGLDDRTIRKSVKAISEADVLIIGGTSLNVYPAAGFINYYNGNKLVLINKSETPYDGQANLLIHDSIGKVLKMCVEA